jgi:hypothetical protein
MRVDYKCNNLGEAKDKKNFSGTIGTNIRLLDDSKHQYKYLIESRTKRIGNTTNEVLLHSWNIEID